MTEIRLLSNSIVICYSTPNYNTLAKMCIESLNAIGIYNIEHLIDTPSETLLQKTGFQTDLWYYCVKQKIIHLVNVLITNKKTTKSYFMFSDCDIIYIEKNKQYWQNLQNIINASDKDIFFMREYQGLDVNTGFFIIKNNDNLDIIIEFFRKVIVELENSNTIDIPFGDQSIINIFKHELNFDYIPNEFVVFGEKIFDKNKSLFHHSVCCRDVEEKLIQIKKVKEMVYEN